MWIVVPLFIIFELLGAYTIVLKGNITKLDYIVVWFALLLCLLALGKV